MIVLAIHKETGEIHMDIQDTPSGGYRPGTRANRAAAVLGGAPDDYLEFKVADKDKALMFDAKEIKWQKHDKKLRITPWSGPEKESRAREKRRQAVEQEMIETQVRADAADKLGLDSTEYKASVARLKAQHEEIKEKQKQERNG